VTSEFYKAYNSKHNGVEYLSEADLLAEPTIRFLTTPDVMLEEPLPPLIVSLDATTGSTLKTCKTGSGDTERLLSSIT